MVTIKMIAKECGYSVATVSKALNDAPDVSVQTRERIRKVAESMGYTSNSAARILKTGRSYNFGILLEDAANLGLTHSFFSQIVNGFKRVAEKQGYDILFISDGLGGKEMSYLEHARYRSCDGILIATADYTDQAVMELVNNGIPVVTIDRVFDSCGSVASDNKKGISDLVHYVYEKGHRRIAFIHGEDCAVTKVRIASFCRACQELGMEVPDEYLVPSKFISPDLAGENTRKLMNLAKPPTCIFYPDDISYIGGFNELERMGLSVPNDVSAVGYDGIYFSQILTPKLTTLEQAGVIMGSKAAEELISAVEEGKSYIPGRCLVQGRLLEGETVKDLLKIDPN